MKITKIPGLGRFGCFIDDLNLNNVSDEEWIEIGQLHLQNLVTIIRDIKVHPVMYEKWIGKWGSHRNLQEYRIRKKYNVKNMYEFVGKTEVNGIPISEEDLQWLIGVGLILAAEVAGPDTKMLKVSGIKNKEGQPLGMFAEGELLWHSNESGNLCFAPAVSLLGHHGVVGSATGFVTTPDWYEEQTEAFRSELDEMVIEHVYTPGRINPGLRKEQDFLMYKNMCPVPNELPLVIQSPAGFKGLHYSVNTINNIKGMTHEESRKVFDYIDKTLFVDKYIYDHWYKQDNDLCLFDNSVTLHRRLGGIANRLCYRIQYDYGNLIDPNYNPYFTEPFRTAYQAEKDDISKVYGHS
jgi:alpha-ketoglutarate-dependent taurine dioxygenase